MKETSDELPKKTIEKKVITTKRLYFNPIHGPIEAESLEDAELQAKALEAKETNTKEEQVGDAR